MPLQNDFQSVLSHCDYVNFLRIHPATSKRSPTTPVVQIGMSIKSALVVRPCPCVSGKKIRTIFLPIIRHTKQIPTMPPPKAFSVSPGLCGGLFDEFGTM